MAKIELIARGLARRDNQVLLCLNRKGGYAYLPGGHVEFGETAREALEREFVEESGIEVTSGGLVFISEGRFEQKGKDRHELNLVFHVEHPHWPDPFPSLEEKIGFGWYDLASLHEVDLKPASIKAWLMAGGRSEHTGGDLPFVSE